MSVPALAADVRARFSAGLDGLLGAVPLPIDAPLGIALSGGPDSSALLLLAASRAAGTVRALTVDHGLRAEAAGEAADAAALCASLGIAHEVVRVDVGRGSIQAAARTARYEALGRWAAAGSLAAVLTAHHADDQAETVLMRLGRGAGVGGLAGIRSAQRFAGGLLVLRPLLGWRKAELEAVCAAAGVVPARDPSNADSQFDRTRARALLAMNDWLDAGRLAASAAHLAGAETALAAIADERFETYRAGGAVVLKPDPLPEIARRHVLRLLAEEFDACPDGPSLDRAIACLRSGARTTCAGILCQADPPAWRFRRAPPRRSRQGPPVPLPLT